MMESFIPKSVISIFGVDIIDDCPDKRLEDAENQVDNNKDNYPCYNYLVFSA